MEENLFVRFVVKGVPVGKERPRASARGGVIRMRTPDKTRSYEAAVKWAAKLAMRGIAVTKKPVFLTITANFTPPASWSAAKAASAINGEIMKSSRPDLDNIVKSIGDACNGIVWTDDAQIVGIHAVKFYAKESCVIVSVAEIVE